MVRFHRRPPRLAWCKRRSASHPLPTKNPYHKIWFFCVNKMKVCLVLHRSQETAKLVNDVLSQCKLIGTIIITVTDLGAVSLHLRASPPTGWDVFFGLFEWCTHEIITTNKKTPLSGRCFFLFREYSAFISVVYWPLNSDIETRLSQKSRSSPRST